jgi:glucosamine-6-phosphate deaminase
MNISISKTPEELGIAAAQLVAMKLNEAIRERGEARLVLSTGSSQFETLNALLKENVDWGKTDIFHLDEYINLPVTHKASFRKYLRERFIDHISCRKFYGIDTEGDLTELISYLTSEISSRQVDVGLIGIGENSHIAFNDPPADFDTTEAYIVVKLDERCKLQQAGEGWFKTPKDVPDTAVTMTVNRIMQCRTIVSAVPHLIKADAVARTIKNKVTNRIPASILKLHNDFNLFLDQNSASGFMTL